MIITCKEDYEKLDETTRLNLCRYWNSADFWDIDDYMDPEYYIDIEYPCVQIETIEYYSVDIYASGTTVRPRLNIDVPVAFSIWYYKEVARCAAKGVITDTLKIMKNHYWMFATLFRGSSMYYKDRDINVYDVEWYTDELSARLLTFLNDFVDFIQDVVEGWISNAEHYLSESYEYCLSDEAVIENLISNEVEVEYEI